MLLLLVDFFRFFLKSITRIIIPLPTSSKPTIPPIKPPMRGPFTGYGAVPVDDGFECCGLNGADCSVPKTADGVDENADGTPLVGAEETAGEEGGVIPAFDGIGIGV